MIKATGKPPGQGEIIPLLAFIRPYSSFSMTFITPFVPEIKAVAKVVFNKINGFQAALYRFSKKMPYMALLLWRILQEKTR